MKESKKISKKFMERHRGYLFLFTWIAIIAFCIIFIVGMSSSIPHPFGRMLVFGLLYAICWALVITLLIAFVWWACDRRNFKRLLFGCACMVTLVALFYAEEDLRGKHDWAKYKREGEAKGNKFDWQAYVPAPVPDDQNFAMSPVWIARIKYNFQNDPQKASTWYGDRVDSDDVAKFYGLMPVSAGALTGTNWASHLPSTPDLTVRWTAARTVDLKPWQSYYRNLEETNHDTGISITPAADVLLALSKFDPAIEQLRKDSQLQYSRFPVKYDMDDPAEILLPHLLAIKQSSQVLELRAIAELQNGQTDAAADDIKLMLRMVDSVQSEPFIITHLVRMAVMQMAIQCIYEGLSEHKWSDAQLAEMDSGLAKINFPEDYQFSILSESAAHAKIMEWLEEKRSRGKVLVDLLTSDNQGKSNSSLQWVGRAVDLMPKGWFYQGDILLSEVDEIWASVPSSNTRRVISPGSVLQASNAMVLADNQASAFNFLGRILTSDLSTYAKRTAFAQESAELAQTAIALERYYLAHGEYPASLDALAPKFMEQIPSDIINGEPLRYHPTPNGRFILYSVGWNEQDDGGTTVPSKGLIGTGVDVDKGDWVWQYPEK